MPGLIAHTGQIWLAVDPVDMRRGMDGLSMIFFLPRPDKPPLMQAALA